MYLYVLKTLLLLVINSLLARVAILAPGFGSGPSLEGAKNISQLADSALHSGFRPWKSQYLVF